MKPIDMDAWFSFAFYSAISLVFDAKLGAFRNVSGIRDSALDVFRLDVKYA